MTEGPPFYDLDFRERAVTWHRLRPECEVEADVPEPPLPSNMRPTKRLQRVQDPEAPHGYRLKAVPVDPLEGREIRHGTVDSGYDRYEIEVYERDPNAGPARLFGDRQPLIRPLGMPWEFDELLRARDTAIEILRAYNFPTFRPRLHYNYAQTIQPLVFAYAWAWHGGNLVWCEDPTGGGGAVYLREADVRDVRRTFTNSDGRQVVFVPGRLSWLEEVRSRLHDYLPRTSAFHWAWQVENLCWYSDIITAEPSSAGLEAPLSRQAWRALGSAGYFFGNWFADFHSRRRHDDDIKYGHLRKSGAERQGQAGRKNSQERAWKRWGEVVCPWVAAYIRESQAPNLGVGTIHSAVFKAMSDRKLPVVPVPNDQTTFGNALKEWEKEGRVPTWSGLANYRKREKR